MEWKLEWKQQNRRCSREPVGSACAKMEFFSPASASKAEPSGRPIKHGDLAAARGKRPLPLLVDIRESPPLSPEVRHYYCSLPLDSFSALGVIFSTSPLGLMMGRIYLALARHSIPTQIFRQETEAVEWLSKYR